MKAISIIYLLILFPFVAEASLNKMIDTIPQTNNYGLVSTSWKKFKNANPASQITPIMAPEASNTGDASLEFPLKLPEARGGFSPLLLINYTSETANTWLGRGWDLTLSSFSIDTRWGAPLFSGSNETETYLYNNQQLGPVFHRNIINERKADRTFTLRQEGAFAKIKRLGNNTSQYTWEVKEKNGTKHYYGGENGVVSNQHTIKTKNNHLIEWHVYSSIDRNNNLITYEYQKVNLRGGVYLYPKRITYNGHNGQPGNYEIQFILQDIARNDIDINARNGVKKVMGHLLDRIEISYQGEIIRTYQLSYKEGAFEKTLLTSIAEIDALGNEFYKYDFDYHDDIRNGTEYNPFNNEDKWSVAKDQVEFSSITGSIDGFKSQPTLLGGAKSSSVGGGLAITVGPPFNPATKDNSVGPNSSYVNTKSTGLTALVDIDGDGLPDKVWKENGKIYYRKNLHTTINPRKTFGFKQELKGINNISESSTSAWSVGAEVNLFAFFGGYSREWEKTDITTYMADFNGDDLLDVASNKVVYFNYLNENGIPTFSRSSQNTPNPILPGEIIGDDLVPADTFDLDSQFPLHDVVRMWKAPYDGQIKIEGTVRLIENTSSEALAYKSADGVRVAIQKGFFENWVDFIPVNDFTPRIPRNVDRMRVSKGDEIYFRVGSVYDGAYDLVEWDPVITYANNKNLTDANGKTFRKFKASEDFIVSKRSGITIPSNGTISINGLFKKARVTDTIRLKIEGDITIDTFFLPTEIIDKNLEIKGIKVRAENNLFFSIYSNTNVDWSTINWQPSISYESFDDGSMVNDQNGNPIIRICPPINYTTYEVINQDVVPILIPESGNLNVKLTTTNFINDIQHATLSIKTQDSIEALVSDISQGELINELEVEKEVQAGDIVYIELHLSSSNKFSFNTNSFEIQLNNQPLVAIPGIYIDDLEEDDSKGQLYRGWGQFAYNSQGAANVPILIGELSFDEDELAKDTALIDKDISDDELMGGNLSQDDRFIVMTSDLKNMAWLGSDEFTYLNSKMISSSRNGNKNPSQEDESVEGEGLRTINIVTRTLSNAGAAGAQVGPGQLGGGITGANAWTISDVTDLNGDRYPDYITQNNIQYTSVRGSITSLRRSHTTSGEINSEAHYSGSLAKGGGVGGSYINSGSRNAGATGGKGSNKSTKRNKSNGNSSLNKSKNAFGTAKSSIGISGNFVRDDDHTDLTFLDINGDGLEDKVFKNGQVALNLGYSFAEKESWGFSGIREGRAFDYGGGLGFSYGNNSIAGGVSVSRTENTSTLGFMDVNGDALVDQITSINPYYVRINRGGSFAPAVKWINADKYDEGVSIGESINGAFTYCQEFLLFRVCINPSVYTGQGSSGIHDAFIDIDGDGYPDFLTSKINDADLTVRTSRIGRTNLLKKVNGPLGGSLEIDYKISGNTADIPFSKWVMSEVKINDGLPGDGVDQQRRTYTYINPYYDRKERQIYGFGKVEENYLDQSDDTQRTIINSYSVADFYTKGLLLSQEIKNKEGLSLQKSKYEYQLKDVSNGNDLPPGFARKDDGSAFPALVNKTIIYTEGQEEFQIIRQLNYQYDVVGNITVEVDNVSGGMQRTTHRSYHNLDEVNILDQLKSETISSGNNIYRRNIFEVDARGNRTAIVQSINSEVTSTTEFKYDNFGNIIEVMRPRNYKDERLVLINEYDAIESQYLQKITDGYGYVEQYKYDARFNNLLEFIDKNNNTTTYTYDERGRLSTETYPKEHISNAPYTMRYEYNIDAEVPYGIAKHFDPLHQDDLSTFTFTDGTHREVQHKTMASLYNEDGSSDRLGFIVSGTDLIDGLGRISASYLPIAEGSGNPQRFNTEIDNVNPIIKEYDALDRLVKLMEIDGGVTNIQYSISQNENGETLFSVHTIDALEVSHTEYYNGRGDIVSTRHDGPEGDIWTHFIYDAVGQVASIIDPNGNVTSYEYDLLGRRIKVKVPDAGVTELRYDAANNLTERITATIREVVSEDGSIRYTYDKERLIGIDYPKFFQNKVVLHYGSPQDSFNRAGRVWLQEDGSGGREFFYDENGNVVKTIRTVMINKSNIFTYVDEASFDSWGRVQTMTYPDAEKVVFKYNKGGQIINITGTKGSETYEYLNYAGYDKFMDRVILKYGNGSRDEYTYDDKGRLFIRQINNQEGPLSSETYQYDLEDNLRERINTNSGSAEIGGTYRESYEYDNHYRLSNASGEWNGKVLQTYNMFFDYDNLNNLSMKSQEIFIDNEKQPLTSRSFDYVYQSSDQPTRPSEVAGRDFTYDANGNLVLVNSEQVFSFEQNFYDEENRLLGHSNDGYISKYTYDAYGLRAIKSHGESQGVFINGAPAGFVDHTKNFEVFVSPYFTAKEHEFVKHFFIDEQRIVSKNGTGIFQTQLGYGPEITAGNLDYKSRIQQYENSILDYYASQGVPPGPPTLLAYSAQPEINAQSLPDASTKNPYNSPPPNWPLLTEPDTTGPPGIPVFYSEYNLSNESVRAGYNFTAGNISKEIDHYIFHYDVNGSAIYISDYGGNLREHRLFLPSGERWIQESREEQNTAYNFNGLYLDEESGLYDMGDIFYDPVFNIEHSLDHRLQNYGQRTFKTRPEGELYYEYADVMLEVEFDPEIINSERPDPILARAPTSVLVKEPDFDQSPDEVFREEDLGFWSDTTPSDTKLNRRKFKFAPNDPQVENWVQELNDLIDFSAIIQAETNGTFDASNAKQWRKFNARVKKQLKKEQKKSNKLKKKRGIRKVRFRIK